MRRTKIVCTIGPASQSRQGLKKMIKAGMDIARLNLAHGTLAEHQRRIDNLRQIDDSVAVLIDLQGPKIRTGRLKKPKITLKAGQTFILTTSEIIGDETRVTVNHKNLPRDVRVGDRILLNDGAIELKVEKKTKASIPCKVIHGGQLGEHNGVNIPGVKLSVPSLTKKDIRDIAWGIRQRVDFIALSFVRSPKDILAIKKILRQSKADIQVIAKLEKPEAIERLEEIIKVSDGLMIARGDLGVEMPLEKIPLIQKLIIQKCGQLGKPVITATQMLESMIKSPRPTRAEASDVANAIFDGTDAVMLSEETATCRYSVESVKTMAKIILETEKTTVFCPPAVERILTIKTIASAVSHATCQVALDLRAQAIVTFTESGSTALLTSKYKPFAPIFAISTRERALRRVRLFWGVSPVKISPFKHTDDMIAKA